ncbi:MAG: TAXI family TRAP transporter solute-binding subunit [Candidatus Rokubacteria bacterium]|nr:TAXI family TRAP transporter solute-binding subunit [Candidatus Rokubacteria bacterium]
MKVRSRSLALFVVIILVFALLVPTAQAQQKRLVTIASGWVVGVYYPLAGAMSRIIHTKMPGLRATVESSGASVANAQLIGSGDADFALLQNDIAFYAYNGVTLGAFKGKPVKNMGGIFTIYPELVQVAATHASGIKSIKDLKGKKVVLGPLGSGTEANALQILEVHGMKEADLGKVERIDAAAAADQLKDGRVDAAFFTTGLGSAVIVDLSVTGKVGLVPVVGAEAEALKRKYPFYTSEVIPANTYKGQEREVTTVAVMAMMVARNELPEDLVYGFVKTIFENLPTFYTAHAQAKGLKLETAVAGMPIPLHPGAAKFYKEKGVLR